MRTRGGTPRSSSAAAVAPFAAATHTPKARATAIQNATRVTCLDACAPHLLFFRWTLRSSLILGDAASSPMSTPSTQPPKNYITPLGLQRLKEEHRFLLTRERPAVTRVVAWAASNGDRSENARLSGPANGGCAKIPPSHSLSHQASRCRGKSWTRKHREPGGRRRRSSSGQRCAMRPPGGRERSGEHRWPGRGRSPLATTSAGCRRWRAR